MPRSSKIQQNPTSNSIANDVKKKVQKNIVFQGPPTWKLCSRFGEAHIFKFSASSKKPRKTMSQGLPKSSEIYHKPFKKLSQKDKIKHAPTYKKICPPSLQHGLQNEPQNRWKIVLDPSWAVLASGCERQVVQTPQNDFKIISKWPPNLSQTREQSNNNNYILIENTMTLSCHFLVTCFSRGIRLRG